MTGEIGIRLPDDLAGELEELEDDRLNQLIAESLRDVLELSDAAEERRAELREKMGLSGQADTEVSDESMTPIERKQAELREKMGGR